MAHARRLRLVPAAADERPYWSQILRALREARGITQEGWAGQLGYARSTVRRWENGEAVPTAAAEAALLSLCRAKGLLRTFERGPLRSLTVTAELLEELLAEARLGTGNEAAASRVAALGSSSARLDGAAVHLPASGPQNNLPLPLTSLIGRDEAVIEIERLLREARLLTLTGVGGTGKTRLALAVAKRLAGSIADGVFFVDLTPLTDPSLVASKIAGALGLAESAGLPIDQALKVYLRDRTLLLVLDNFEHLLEGAPLVPEFLATAPGLTVLTTSRAPLRVSGEREYHVPTLAVPDSRAPDGAAVERSAAVTLFVERARDARQDFRLSEANRATVAEICRRLDGLPLALELAAARLRSLGPNALLVRLDQRLTLLVDGRRDAPARQQTLRDTIAWSYDLLNQDEQRLFRRLAVFAGGCSLEALEAICADEDLGAGVLNAAASLVEKNLIRRDDEEETERFSMLESLRLFALEQLAASGEEARVRARHAAYFLALGEEAAPRLTTDDQQTWLRRLETEHDNLRTALTLARESGDIETWLRLAGALAWFWQLRGHYSEGRAWLAGALATEAGSVPAIVRARALYGAGLLAVYAGDYEAALPLLNTALATARSSGELHLTARLLFFLSLSGWFRGDALTARTFGDEAVAIGRAIADPWVVGQTLATFALLAWRDGDLDSARRHSDEGWALARKSGDGWAASFHLMTLGRVAAQQGDLSSARAHLEEALTLRREAGYPFFIAHSLAALGDVARRAENLTEAASYAGEALSVFRDLGNLSGIALCLVSIAGVQAERGEPVLAARLLGAAETVRDAAGADLSLVSRADYEHDVAQLRVTLGEESLAAAWAEGCCLSLGAAIALALAGHEKPVTSMRPRLPRPS